MLLVYSFGHSGAAPISGSAVGEPSRLGKGAAAKLSGKGGHSAYKVKEGQDDGVHQPHKPHKGKNGSKGGGKGDKTESKGPAPTAN